MRFFKKIFFFIDQVIFSPKCILCLSPCESVEICEACIKYLPWIKHSCHQCGLPLASAQAKLCGTCINNPPDFEKSFIPMRYASPINHMIHLFKFKRKLQYAPILAKLILLQLNNETDNIDAIIPIPLHPKKLSKRGFNQSYILAKIISKKTGIPINYQALKRKKSTQPQYALKKNQRLKNLKGAFECDLSPKNVLLIDDVVTTTATVQSAALCLKQSGAEKIYIAAVARADIPN